MPANRYPDTYNPPPDGSPPYPVGHWDSDVTISSGLYNPQTEYVVCWSDRHGHHVAVYDRTSSHPELRRHHYQTASDVWVAIRTSNWRYLDASANCNLCLATRYIHNANFRVGNDPNTIECGRCETRETRVQSERMSRCDRETAAGRQTRTAKLVKSIRYADYH